MRAAFLIAACTSGMYAANGVNMAFLAVLLSARGLTATDITLALGMSQLVRVAAGPVWGMAADRIGSVRVVLAVASLVAGVAALALLSLNGFWPLLGMVLLSSAAASALMPLSDTLTLAAARLLNFDFGRVRAAGSGAFIVGAMGAGFAVAVFGSNSIAWLMAAGYGVSIAVLPLVPEARAVRTNEVAVALPSPLTIPAFRLMLGSSVLIQGAHAAYYALSTLHWRAAGLSDEVVGLLWAEGVLAEIIVLITCRRVVQRLGPAKLIAISAVGSVIRWIGTALFVDPLVLAVLQPLHAVSFTLQYLASIQIMTHCVPGRRAASAQSLNAALGVAGPTGVVMFLSGLIYTQIGGHVFLFMAGIAACSMFLVPGLKRRVAWR